MQGRVAVHVRQVDIRPKIDEKLRETSCQPAKDLPELGSTHVDETFLALLRSNVQRRLVFCVAPVQDEGD